MRVISKSLGSIYIQPESMNPDDITRSTLAIYPHRITKTQIGAAIEWAAGSQTPIFCHESDIARMETQGFGAYRFHGISGYKEIGFQGGAVEFYPGRRQRNAGLKSLFVDFCELFGFLRPPAYHVLIRPSAERPVLFLCTPQIDSVEWSVLTRTKPSIIIGSAEIPDDEWERFGRAKEVKIFRGRDTKEIHADSSVAVEKRKDQGALWTEEISSLS